MMKEQILDRTDRGLHIFNYYMPFEFKPKKNFKNPLYADSKGSCNIYFDGRSNCYKMHDFGNIDFSGDCFWFVATLNKLDVRRDFVEVMQIINRDLCLDINRNYNNTVNKVVNTFTTQIITESKNINNKIVPEPSLIIPKPYKTLEKTYSKDELSYWSQYGITLKELNRYKCCNRYNNNPF